ncbi:MAG: hypothetical protein JJU34_17755 [Lunatimonas sp.]|nr:hypothetical protein [Lunatimonas sp.]MCC5939129.1 hypothetical protein [Lunatimonas sp.]
MKIVLATMLLLAAMTACGHLEKEDLSPSKDRIPTTEMSKRYQDNTDPGD